MIRSGLPNEGLQARALSAGVRVARWVLVAYRLALLALILIVAPAVCGAVLVRFTLPALERFAP